MSHQEYNECPDREALGPTIIMHASVKARIIQCYAPTSISLRDHEVGFRQCRGCIDQIAKPTLRIIVEQSMEFGSSLYINFVDYMRSHSIALTETPSGSCFDNLVYHPKNI